MEETQVLGNFFDLVDVEVLPPPVIEETTKEKIKQAYLRPIVKPTIEPEVKPIEEYIPKTKDELEYIFVKTFDNRMSSFEVIERVGRVYLCKFLPIRQADPVLAWVDIDNNEFDKNFADMGQTFMSDPYLRSSLLIENLTGFYEKNKKILKDFLNKEEFEFYKRTTEKTITDPAYYYTKQLVTEEYPDVRPFYEKYPGVFYSGLFLTIVTITIAILSVFAS